MNGGRIARVVREVADTPYTSGGDTHVATTTTAPLLTLADLLERLGGIPPARVRYSPTPGTATEADVIAIEKRENRLCELVDGILVEKPLGLKESIVAGRIVRLVGAFVDAGNLGAVSTPDGMMRLFPGRVRIPDVAFIAWERLPGGRVPDEPIPSVVPDLAVEVLSESNTAAEMRMKLADYFAAGTRQAWLVDVERRLVHQYSSSDTFMTLRARDVLDAGDVLPGFTVMVADLFTDLDGPSSAAAAPPGG